MSCRNGSSPAILMALAFLAFVASARSGAAHELVPAPYQVEGLVQLKSDRYVGSSVTELSPPYIMVDLGSAEGQPHPEHFDFKEMTVLGTEGVAIRRLTEIQRHCNYPCGGEGTGECHYVGLLGVQGPEADIGTPLAVLPGRHEIAAYRSLSTEALTGPVSLPEGVLRPEPSDLAWQPYKDGPQARINSWDGAARRLDMDLQWRNGDVFSGDGQSCQVRRAEQLTVLSCNPVAVIVATGAPPLLLSYPDYNVASAQPLAAFEIGEVTYYLISLGLKAQNVSGLLARTPNRWHGLFRPRDYALLC